MRSTSECDFCKTFLGGDFSVEQDKSLLRLRRPHRTLRDR